MRAGSRETGGSAPARRGRARSLWTAFGLLGALLVGIAWARVALAEPDLLYSGDFEYYPEPADSSVVVTPPFELTGRPSSVEVAVSTDLDNASVYFDYALIEQRTGRAIEFGHEVAYSHGSGTAEGYDVKGTRHSEYDWAEGSRDDAVRVPRVLPGWYVLRIAPEGPTPVLYGVKVRRDVPRLEPYAAAFLLLLVPPVFASLRRRRRPPAGGPGGSSPGSREA